MSNKSIKAFSVLLAILLAVAVGSSSNASIVTLMVPLAIQNAPEGKVLVRPRKRDVQVTIQGPSFLVGGIASSPPAMKVSLPNQKTDIFKVFLKPSDVSLPPMVRVVSIEPAETELTFETLERREAQVAVPRIGQLPRNLVLEGIEPAEQRVIISGPKSEVRAIRVVETEPIDLSDFSETRTVRVRLRAPNGEVSLSEGHVAVTVRVSSIPHERGMGLRPVELRSASQFGGVRLLPREVSVLIAGEASRVSELDPTEVIPYVRLQSGPVRDGVELPVDVEVPSGIKVIRVEPSKVRIGTLSTSSKGKGKDR
jgi:YbbR domain-containing protein